MEMKTRTDLCVKCGILIEAFMRKLRESGVLEE